jgi:hydrogenase/urease accessory protein HupE
MSTVPGWARVALALIALATCTPSLAHEARPVAISIAEQGGGIYAVEVRAPGTIEPGNRPLVEWPAGCATVSARSVRCMQPLAGRDITIGWPVYNPAVTVLLRFTPRDGATRTAVLPPAESHWSIPSRPTARGVIGSYLGLGVQHILGGADHLLFVAGLLLVAGSLRRMVLAVSGFTLAHSMTLSLAALGIVHVPVPPTEAAIALSILFLAREVVLHDATSLAHRHPVVISTTFGLLHGLGFAAALGEVGLPDREIPLALLSFNLGVEIGQLAFIVVVLGCVALARRMSMHARGIASVRLHARMVAAYLIGVPAAFWLMQRL